MTIDNKSRIRQKNHREQSMRNCTEFQNLIFDTIGQKCSPDFRYLVNYSTYES